LGLFVSAVLKLAKSYSLLCDRSFESSAAKLVKWSFCQAAGFVANLRHLSRATAVQLRVTLGILGLEEVEAGFGTGLIR